MIYAANATSSALHSGTQPLQGNKRESGAWSTFGIVSTAAGQTRCGIKGQGLLRGRAPPLLRTGVKGRAKYQCNMLDLKGRGIVQITAGD